MGRNEREVAEEWRSATWEGATREAMRRWAKLPLEQLIAAQEEMWDLAEAFNDAHRRKNPPRK